MMKKLGILLFTVVLGACSSVHIKGVSKTDDFVLSNYKSFGFFEISTDGDAIGENYQGNLKLLKEAVTKQLTARNLVLSDGNSDLVVNIGIVVAEKVQTRQTSFSDPSDRTAYMGQRNYTWKSEEVEVGRYREGTVTIHLVDKKKNKLVWQGSADSVMPQKEKNVPALIDEGMTKLFEKLK